MTTNFKQLEKQLVNKLSKLKQQLNEPSQAGNLYSLIKEISITKLELDLITDPEYQQILNCIPDYDDEYIQKFRESGI